MKAKPSSQGGRKKVRARPKRSGAAKRRHPAPKKKAPRLSTAPRG